MTTKHTIEPPCNLQNGAAEVPAPPKPKTSRIDGSGLKRETLFGKSEAQPLKDLSIYRSYALSRWARLWVWQPVKNRSEAQVIFREPSSTKGPRLETEDVMQVQINGSVKPPF